MLFSPKVDNFVLSCLLFVYMGAISTGIATLGQVLGLPEMNISEKLSGSNNQTVPAYTGPGIAGSGGYVTSPVNSPVSAYPVSNGVYQSGPSAGQSASPVLGASTSVSNGSGGSSGAYGSSQQSSGDSELTALKKIANPNPTQVTRIAELEKLNPPTFQGPSDSEINSIYDPTMNYLNQAEQGIRNDFPSALDAAQKQYESVISELQANKQKNLTTIGENQITATNQKEDALSVARRMYDELRRGYQQRFGGSTSAGQAASELSAVEQQRQQGGITRDYNTTMRQTEQQKAQLETEYQASTAKVQESKAMAISQANRDFQNQLLQISSQRAQTESAKAAAKLDALNTLRNEAYKAQQQAYTYQQNLDAMYRQSQLDVQNYLAKINATGSASTTAANNYQTPTPTTSLTMGNTGTASTGLTGTTTGTNKRWDAATGQWVNA